MPFTSNTQPIPKIFHFIWVGGPIFPKYLKSVQGLAKIAKRDGYKINLWVDNPENYYKTSDKENITIPDLHIKDIQTELFEPMAKDPFYQGLDPQFPLDKGERSRATLFQANVRREIAGPFRNLAAAADLIRYEILRKNGGWYCDTDIYFEDINPPFYPDFPEEIDPTDDSYEEKMTINYYTTCYEIYTKKFISYNKSHAIPAFPQAPDPRLKNYVKVKDQNQHSANFDYTFTQEDYDRLMAMFQEACRSIHAKKEKTKTVHLEQRDDDISVLGIKGKLGRFKSNKQNGIFYHHLIEEYPCNDIIGAVRDSNIIKQVILDSIKNYEVEDNKALNSNKKFTFMDEKRNPHGNTQMRKLFTLFWTGPMALISPINSAWDKKQEEIIDALLLERKTSEEINKLIQKAFNSLFLTNCEMDDHSIAGIKAGGVCDQSWLRRTKKISAETNSIPNTTIFSSHK